MLALDGVYSEDDDGFIRFHTVGSPTDKEVKRVAGHIARRIEKLMRRQCPKSDDLETEQSIQPFFSELYGAAVMGRALSGPRAGQQAVRLVGLENEHGNEETSSPRCVNVNGVGLHANTVIPAHDRMRLERLIRYMGRPPIALERLKPLSDGRLLYRLKKQWRDGTSKIIFQPLELMERLAALVPAPRFNMIRYSGVLAPSAAWRRIIVPKEANTETETAEDKTAKKNAHSRPRRYAWAELLKRVFAVDALKCDRCGNSMRILCAINPPDAVRKILDCLGLPSRPPPIAPSAIPCEYA
jgi:hypothetical protein